MSETEILDPEWPEILQACQDQLAARIHTSLPAIVVSYDSETQTATVQLAVQLDGVSIPPLADVPVIWPGGNAGFLHVPLEEGDTVHVEFCEEDFSKWWSTGSVSAPQVLARHGLHAVAIPGLRHAGATFDATGGHVTLATTSELRLGDDSANDAVALKTPVEQGLLDLIDGIISAGGSITAPGGGPAFVAAMTSFKATFAGALGVGATKVKAV